MNPNKRNKAEQRLLASPRFKRHGTAKERLIARNRQRKARVMQTVPISAGSSDHHSMVMALAEYDPFLRPYDGDSVGTHGDPSNFHCSLNRSNVKDRVECWFTCGPHAATGDWTRVFVLGDFSARYDAEGNPTAVEEAHQYLKRSCIWGGCDKRRESSRGEWWGYEIPSERYAAIIAELESRLGQPIDQQEALK